MTTNKSRLRMLGLAAAALLTALPALADNYLPAWAFGGFVRPEGGKPAHQAPYRHLVPLPHARQDRGLGVCRHV